MTTMSHFTPSQAYVLEGETWKQGQERRRAGFNKLKAAGYANRYFTFADGDAEAKRQAKAACEELAAKATAETGVVVTAAEGFFM